jgi:4-diphosphocytidyl-2-C-methyl-D-erythritol kinase
MRVPAPAKINLHLRVAPRQADGFHPLLTWMTTVGLFDTLTLVRRRLDESAASRSGSFRWFTLSCSDPGLPVDGSNLVTRAARALADALSQVGEGLTGPRREEASAFLIKRIPRGAGLGGGSSDAAAAILGLNRLWGLKLPHQRLMGIAADLGSDVPFFLHGPSCVCSGRGQRVREIDRPAMKWVTLILPPFEISTADVYRRFDEMGLGSEEAVLDKPNWTAWTKCSANELMPQLVNDLEPAAFSLRPELGELRAKLEQELSAVVRMSGSGSSLFVLADDREEAKSRAEKVKMTLGVGAMDIEVAPARVSDPED